MNISTRVPIFKPKLLNAFSNILKIVLSHSSLPSWFRKDVSSSIKSRNFSDFALSFLHLRNPFIILPLYVTMNGESFTFRLKLQQYIRATLSAPCQSASASPVQPAARMQCRQRLTRSITILALSVIPAPLDTAYNTQLGRLNSTRNTSRNQ